MMLLLFAAIAAGAFAGSVTRSLWPLFAVFLLSIAIQVRTGLAFPSRGQGRWFQMWNRNDEPDEFRYSLLVQMSFAAVLAIGAAALMIAEWRSS
jgi:hypothetical protein